MTDSKSRPKKGNTFEDTDEIFTYYIILIKMLKDFRQKIKDGYCAVKK